MEIYTYILIYIDREREREREREKAFGKRRPKLQTHSRGIRHRLVLDSCHFWLVLEHGRSSSFWNACLLCRFVAFFFCRGFSIFLGEALLICGFMWFPCFFVLSIFLVLFLVCCHPGGTFFFRLISDF